MVVTPYGPNTRLWLTCCQGIHPEIPLEAEASQVSGEGIVSGEVTFKFTPYVAPPKRKRRTTKIPEVIPETVAITVSAPIVLAEPVSFALDVDTLAEAGESIERVMGNLDELRTLVHKEAKRRKRRKRMLALITIQ